MKTLKLLSAVRFLIAIFLLSIIANNLRAQTWQNVGTSGFSVANAADLTLKINSSGTPYVCFRQISPYKLSCMKYDGSGWIYVGIAGFTPGSALYNSFALDNNGVPCVAFADGANGDKLSVMKFDGTNWVNVGLPGFSSAYSSNVSLAFDAANNPYVVYKNSDKLYALMFDGSSWVPIGSTYAAQVTGVKFDLACYGNTPYLAFGDNSGVVGGKASVKKFDGADWVYVGTVGFSGGTVGRVSLAFNSSGIPFVFYYRTDIVNSSLGKVLEFRSGSWVEYYFGGYSTHNVARTSIALNSSGIPYVAFQDLSNSCYGATVQSTNWSAVGTACFSPGRTDRDVSLAINGAGIPYVAFEDGADSNKITVMQYATVAPTILTGTISPTHFCPGGAVSIPYVATGTFNGGNVFTAQLSNASGNFFSPYNIGTLSSTLSGTINGTMPSVIPSGTGYRIRVVGSDPATTGGDNGNNLSIGCLAVTGTASNTICTGYSNGSINITVSDGTTPYSFAWSNDSTTEDVAGLAAGTYTVTVTDNATSTASASFTVGTTVPTAKPATPAIPTGTTAVCIGSTYTYSVAAVTNAAYYTWTVPATASIISGQGTRTVSVKFNTGFASGTLYVYATNCIGNSSSRTYAVAKLAAPVTVGTISGSTVICVGDIKTYSIAAVTRATSYTWTPPANAQINSGQGTTSVTIQYLTGFTTGNVSVNAANCTGSNTKALAIKVIPSTPGAITGQTLSVCGGSSKIYSIAAVTGATGYNWVVTGASIVVYYGTSIEVAFPLGYTSATIKVQATTACATSAFNTAITVKPTTATPGAITGAKYNVCYNGGETYSIASVTGAASYNWVVTGATISAGQGTSNLYVVFPSLYTTATIKVQAISACGVASAYSAVITVRPTPPVPGAITGTFKQVCGGTSQSYTVPFITNDSSGSSWGLTYNWVVTGATIASGQGTNSITVNFPSGYTTATIKVQSVNFCSSSAFNTAVTTSPVLSFPANAIKGTYTGHCGTPSQQHFWISPLAGATSYLWCYPAQTTLAGAQGTTDLYLNVPSTFTYGAVCVQAIGTCNIAGPASTSTIFSNAPAKPDSIGGRSAACRNSTNNYSCYVPYGWVYTWTLPSGWSFINTQQQGNNTIWVNAGSSGGTISVVVSNDCGTAAARTKTVTVTTSCKTDETNPVLEEEEITSDIKVYPNPFSDNLNIEFALPDDAHVTLEIFNISGQRLAVLYDGEVKANEITKAEYYPQDVSSSIIVYRLQTEQGSYWGKAVMSAD